MSEETQKKDRTEKKQPEEKKNLNAANWGFAAGGFVAGAAVSGAFAMNSGNSDEVIETDVVNDEPVNDDDNNQGEETVIETEPDQNFVQDSDQDEVHETVSENVESEVIQTDNGLPHYDNAPVAHVSDSQSFAQAFADARQQVGPGGIFEWHGQVYGTYYANEWNSMSQEQRNDYWASVDTHAAHDEDWNPHHQQQQNVVQHEPEQSNLMASNEEHLDHDPSPHVEVGEIVSEGNLTVAEVSIDGADLLMADTDGDGVIDTVGADIDGDGYVSAYEQASVQELGIDAPIDVADLEEMGGHYGVEDPSQIADTEPDMNDYQPDGFDEMVAQEDFGMDDMMDA